MALVPLSDRAVKRLSGAYVVANSAAFLLTEFRQDEAVRRMSDAHTEDELVQFILSADTADERTLADVINAYSATVALTFKSSADIEAALEDVTICNLVWVGGILVEWFMTYSPSSQASVDAGRFKFRSPDVISTSRSTSDVMNGGNHA